MSTVGSGAQTRLLRLLHLTSPALPLGAFAYSQGLESAVVEGLVHDEESLQGWIQGLLEYALIELDVPLLLRLYDGWQNRDTRAIRKTNDWLYAARGTRELQDEDEHLGGALARVLASLGVPEATPWEFDPRVTYANMFALAGARWEIEKTDVALGYCFVWLEGQVGAATRLLPLGQTAAQRVVAATLVLVPELVERSSRLLDDDMDGSCPGQARASARHETLYSRLFRS